MKKLFIFRNSYDARYILSKIEEKGLLDGIILEKGIGAKKRKLQRIFQHKSIVNYPGLILDILALILFSGYVNTKVNKKLGLYSYPKEKIKLVVDNANENICLDYIRQYKPDVIFIYGVSILSDRFLKSTKAKVLNIHSGILPKYRNVHSDFWAYLNQDYNNIGVTLIYVDKGIDTGDIAFQNRIKYAKGDDLVDIKIKILRLIPNLIAEATRNIQKNKVNRKKQNMQKSHFYPTPGFSDIIKYFLR